ncbi:MAG: molybdopterin-dependent oxidoreductase [Gemmataceae bacterium]|nr:molybdopterin-dependent oxidoreductase [Gemmataceae bacterium]
MPDPRTHLVGPAAEAEIRRLTRRSLLVGGVATAVGAGALAALRYGPDEAGIPWFLRRVLEGNERLARATFSNRLAPEFPRARAAIPRVNGRYGMAETTDSASWTITLVRPDRHDAVLTLPALYGLPRSEMITELKCVEGWSEVVAWGGVRFSDFAAKFGPAPGQFDYVALATPDGGYYVGLDAASALHPQTLLCDTLNGEPLPAEHGGPLRLVIPVKYGVKNIKQIGRIEFTRKRPADYWAERGYDWYLGL